MGIFTSHLLGDLWSPPAMGLVADHAPFQVAMLVVPVAFAVAGVLWRAGSKAADAVASTTRVASGPAEPGPAPSGPAV
jgi:hypothetical protein